MTRRTPYPGYSKPPSAWQHSRDLPTSGTPHRATEKTDGGSKAEGILWHALPIKMITSLCITDPAQGLTDAEADARRAVFQKNTPHIRPFRWRPCFSTSHDAIKALLLVACLTFAFLQQWTNVLAALLLYLVCEWWVVWNGSRTKQARLVLSGLGEWKARVMRNGTFTTRPAAELVPGDIIELRTGDIIPADGRLFLAQSLRCGEEALRALPARAHKSTATTASDVPLSGRRGMIYMGTRVLSGSGRAIVVATGMDTALALLAWPALSGLHPVGELDDQEQPAPA